MAFSPTISNSLSRNLSYTNSLDPGEDSQLMALAMVDKLVDFSADLPWQASKPKNEADQANEKVSQSAKGVQILAQNADAKNRQVNFGIFDWLDSQPNDTENDTSKIITEGKCNNYRKEKGSVECRLIQSRNIVNNEEHDLGGQEDVFIPDIGTNSQVALDAIDILRHGSPGGCPGEKEGSSSVVDIGSDTQTALDAINILRHGIEPIVQGEKEEKCKDLECIKQGESNEISSIGRKKASVCEAHPGTKRGLPPVARKGIKPLAKRGSRKSGASKVLRKPEKTSSWKSSDPDLNRIKVFHLEFFGPMVPRRRRSQVRSRRVSIEKNSYAHGCLEAGISPSSEIVKQDKAETGMIVRTDESTVTSLSTYVRRIKKDVSTKLDCHMLFDQSRKRRKCETKSVFVLFSHGLAESTVNEQKKMLTKLGGHVATSAAKATHFISDSFARSKNMLEIMAAGKAVVTTNWLEGCSQAQYFVHEETYILKDTQKEKEWGFCMHSSLAASRRRPLLKDMKVVVSPNTVPDFTAIKSIIESGGGQVLQLSTLQNLLLDNDKASISFVLASEEDFDFCSEYIRNGFRVFSSELLLHGVITQSFDFSRNRLFVI